MKLKPGVRLLGIRPELVVALLIADGLFREAGAECVITSCIDGKHSRGSKHYSGCAFDLRTHSLSNPSATAMTLQVRLGSDFDVILEDASGPNQHIHVEYDPKEEI